MAWTLLDPSGARVGANAIITLYEPPTADMTAATTATLAPGHYTEELRITLAGKTSDFQGCR